MEVAVPDRIQIHEITTLTSRLVLDHIFKQYNDSKQSSACCLEK